MLYRGKANKRTHLAPFGSTANLSFCKTHEKAGFFFWLSPPACFGAAVGFLKTAARRRTFTVAASAWCRLDTTM
jgi:hypothetical protein